MKKFIAIVCLISFTLKAQKINVYDTLVHANKFNVALFDVKKSNFTLTEKGKLKRNVSLPANDFSYHKNSEDSLNNFLKRIYPNNFTGFDFYAAENVNWTLEEKNSFSWKKGKIIDNKKLANVYTSEYEVGNVFKRPNYLKDEEDAHCFFFNYYLHDSATKSVYCYNKLTGWYNGKIIYNAKHEIEYEIAYHSNRTTFIELKDGVFTVYSELNAKLFEHTATEIICYQNNAVAWKYNTVTKKTESFVEQKQLGWNPELDYVVKLQALWRENFKE